MLALASKMVTDNLGLGVDPLTCYRVRPYAGCSSRRREALAVVHEVRRGPALPRPGRSQERVSPRACVSGCHDLVEIAKPGADLAGGSPRRHEPAFSSTLCSLITCR
jgi:hypothetical protein